MQNYQFSSQTVLVCVCVWVCYGAKRFHIFNRRDEWTFFLFFVQLKTRFGFKELNKQYKLASSGLISTLFCSLKTVFAQNICIFACIGSISLSTHRQAAIVLAAHSNSSISALSRTRAHTHHVAYLGAPPLHTTTTTTTTMS